MGVLVGALSVTNALWGDDPNALEWTAGTFGSAAVGAGAGALVGARIRTGGWRTVDLPPPIPVADQ